MSPRIANQESRGRPRTKRALVLGGGGLLGAMFQIAALSALEEADPRQTEFDLAVGTSGGAVVAALLAAGLRPAELRRMAPSFAPADLSRTCWRSLLAWPTFVLVDDSGTIAWRQTGYSPQKKLSVGDWQWEQHPQGKD